LLEAFVHVGAPTLQLKLKLKMEKIWKAEEEENGQHDNVAKYTWRWGAKIFEERETLAFQNHQEMSEPDITRIFF
jgi:hypothetical protein